MTAALLHLAVALTALTVAVLFLRWVELRRAWLDPLAFGLRFPRDVDPNAATTALAGLSAVRPPWYWRWLRVPIVRAEVRASAGHIMHLLVVPRPLASVVVTHLRAAMSSLRLERVPLPEPFEATAAVELRLTTRRRPLKTERLRDVTTAVLHGLQPLRADEAVTLQWLLTPAPLPRPPRVPSTRDEHGARGALTRADGYELLPHAEALRAERSKQQQPLFWSVGRVSVRASSRVRARSLLNRALAGYHLLNAPGVSLQRRLVVPSVWAVRRLRRTSMPVLLWPALLNAAELTGVVAWPVGVSQLPGLELGGCRQLPPAADIPASGCVIARATYPGSERPVAIAPGDRFIHALLTGPTGSGKSNLLLNLITQDMRAGRACVVVDPKGDLVAECLKRVPPERVRDVIVLDPADDTRPVGFNLLAGERGSAELVAEQVVFIFHQLFAAFWGPRTDDVLRAALLTLMREPDMTLVEVPLLLNNAAWRRRFVDAVRDDVVGLAPFWSWYDSLSAAERSQVIAPLMNKLRATLLRSRVRYCIGQSQPSVQLETVLEQNKLLFLPLRKGVLGEEAAALLGSLFVARLWQAVQARTAQPEHARRPVQLYIDEVQDYLRLPTSVGDMLAQARGLKLGLTLAHQHLGQLTPELRQDLLANCRSKIIFQTTARDARVFAQELSPYLTAEDFQGLGRFEVVASLAVGQRVAPPVTGVTLPPPPEAHRGASARAWSRQFYGRDVAEIDAAMRTRHVVPVDGSPVGQRRRPKERS